MKTRLNKVLRTFRATEWWEYKIAPILAIAYATFINLDSSIHLNITWIVFLLFSVTIGAIFVSTINDITDLQDDLASGKTNRMAKINSKYRWIIPTGCALLGLVSISIFFPDRISIALYILPWIAYSLYSFKPFRLKERGFWGVLADAFGAHVFVSLLIVSSLSYIVERSIDWLWFSTIGFWSLIVGIKGILWHQYYDRDNDLISNTRTFATKVIPYKIQKVEKLLMGVELFALGIILARINSIIIFLFFGLYLILVCLRYIALDHKVTIILFSQDEKSQILMFDFYIAILPLSLLIHSALIEPKNWWVLLIHLLLFPKTMIKILRELKVLSRLALRGYVSP